MKTNLTTSVQSSAMRRIAAGLATTSLALALAFALPAADKPAAPAAAEPTPLRIAVLPFQNATGDAAQADWEQALAGLIRSCLVEAEFMSTPGWKKVQQALAHAGWTAASAGNAKLARQVAQELNADVAVWGSFRRQTNGWAVDAKLLRTDRETAPMELHFMSPRWVDLAESLALGLAKQLDRRIADDERQNWKLYLPESELAVQCLAKAITLTTQEAPASDREKAWRDVLAADPRCGLAHAKLCEIFADAKQKDEFEKAVREFVRQRPGLCSAHGYLAQVLLQNQEMEGAKRELVEALRLHRGCPQTARALFVILGAIEERWADLRKVLEAAHNVRPDNVNNTILLACARAQCGDIESAHELLHSVKELPEENEDVDLALLSAAFATGEIELAGRELLRLGPMAAESEAISTALAGFSCGWKDNSNSITPIVRPRGFGPGELSAELDRRLSVAERRLVVNPVEITPEITAEARRLTVGLTNDTLRVFALYAEVARRGLGPGDGGRRTAPEALKDSTDPQTRLSCQEYAKLFVALARALGLEAWMVHVERCADGSPGYHDCAALFLEGRGLLIDPTWRVLAIRHEVFTVLDDVQAISHQAMQGSSVPDPQRLRLGLKLNPEDRWTRLQFVRGMAKAGEPAAAAEELRKVQATGAEGWDVHEAAAELEVARERWTAALAELQAALTFNSSNAVVHAQLALVYFQLNEPVKAREHTEAALRFDRGEISAQGRLESQSQLALAAAFAQGKSGDRRSLDDLKRRAESGELAAQLVLAKTCLEDQPPRTEEGMRWLLKAAEQGDDNAQFNYARNLLVLRGKEAGAEVIQWLTRSAQQGNVEARYRLGLFLYEGKLVPGDNVAAGQWILLAAGQGSLEAKRLFKEMEIFLDADELKQARQRADSFNPLKNKSATSNP